MTHTVIIESDRNFHRAPPTPAVDKKLDIAFDTVDQLDDDADLAFQLRGTASTHWWMPRCPCLVWRFVCAA